MYYLKNIVLKKKTYLKNIVLKKDISIKYNNITIFKVYLYKLLYYFLLAIKNNFLSISLFSSAFAFTNKSILMVDSFSACNCK
jgi:hypothetical protein